MQDPNVMPWGALDRYQAHYIVKIPDYDNSSHSKPTVFAKTDLETDGHFASKRVVSVRWAGISSELLERLNNDGDLNALIAKQSAWDAAIHIEQTDENIRIHGRWNDKASFGASAEMFEIYDRIAGHVKASCLPPV